jgi:hypothetical protein
MATNHEVGSSNLSGRANYRSTAKHESHEHPDGGVAAAREVTGLLLKDARVISWRMN